MRKIMLVAWREFSQMIRKRGFVLTAVGTPLLLFVLWGVAGVFNTGQTQPAEELLQAEAPNQPVGYVDQADLIETIPPPASEALFRSYADVAAADAALTGGEIAAYYVIPPDYRETGAVRRVSPEFPSGEPDTTLFEWILVYNLLPDASPELVSRLNWPFNATGPQFVAISAEEEGGSAGGGIMPFLVAMIIMIPLFTSGSYLFQSLANEKSSRIMEMLLVSLRPLDLLAGKLLGLGALTLVQYVGWVGVAALALAVLGRDPSEFLAGVNLTAQELLVVLPYALGGYLLYSALMAGLGALAPNMESSRGWTFVITLPMLIPIYLWSGIASAPHGALAIALSLFPFSAPLAMLMRMTAAVVPAWQIGLSLLLLLLTGVGMVLLMARLFRVQTLLSGEALSMRRFWSALTSGS